MNLSDQQVMFSSDRCTSHYKQISWHSEYNLDSQAAHLWGQSYGLIVDLSIIPCVTVKLIIVNQNHCILFAVFKTVYNTQYMLI